MNEFLTSFTALPNIHPALVHFPVALLPTAALFDLISFRRGLDWLGRAATALYAAAGLGAGAAYWAGRQAADSLRGVSPQIQLRLNEHSDSALYALWFVGILAALRIGLDIWDRKRERRSLRLLFLLAALAGVGLLFRTADLGGALVYRHGVAVARADDAGEEVAVDEHALHSEPSAGLVDEGPAVSRLVTGANGVLEWRPSRGDRDALGSILMPADGSDLAAVSWVESTNQAPGLSVEVQGEALLVLPGTFGDVQVEAELALEGFEGVIGVAHHVRGGDRAGLFTLEVPSNEFVLGSVDGGALGALDRDTVDLPSDTIRVTVSAIGRHLKGLLGDETVVHGHEPALPEGACGLLLRGEGSVRIVMLRVTPVSE